MPQNDEAVLVAAVGYVFVGAPGTAAPTPAELAAIDPATFGSKTITIKFTGTPTGGDVDFVIASENVDNIPFNVTKEALTTAIEAELGVGSVIVTGTSISDANGFDVTFVGAYQGSNVSVTATPALTGGTTPTATITVKTAVNGWTPSGHTSVNDMPEFGFDGGDSEVKGTWQKKKLREITTDEPIDYMTLFLHQFDTDNLELYYGTDKAIGIPGVFGVASGSKPVEKAFLVVIVDGDEKIGFYAAKASVKRDDAIDMPSDEFSSLPVKATFLDMPGRRLFDWISEKLFR